MKYSVEELKPGTESFGTAPPPVSSPFHRGPDELTKMNVAIFVESVDDQGEDQADVAGVVIS